MNMEENFNALDVIARTWGKVELDNLPYGDRLFPLWGGLAAIFYLAEFLLWQWLALGFSSLGLALLSLALAVGPFGWELFQGYFAQPLIFLLNFLPVLLLQTLLWLLFGRQWLSFLVTALLILTASAGNFYKLRNCRLTTCIF